MKFFAGVYSVFVYLGKILQPFLLLALRLFWGWAFFQAGYNKLGNMNETIQFFGSLNIPNTDIMAHTVAWIEMLGGALLFFGFMARLAAIPLIIVMATALGTAHYDASVNLLNNQSEFISQAPVTYLMVAAIVLSFGPGLFSIDALLKNQFSKD